RRRASPASPGCSRRLAACSSSSDCSRGRWPSFSRARWRSRISWATRHRAFGRCSIRGIPPSCSALSGFISPPPGRGRGAWMPSGGGKPLDRSIVEGPLARAVWMLAWPTMLQNLIGGLQGVVNAAPAVRVEALPFLRIMFVGSLGMLLFFMVSGALRAAGDARTPLRLGILLTVLNIACNVAFITGLGPLPRLGTAGAAVGTAVAGIVVSGIAGYLLLSGRLPVTWHRGMSWRPDWGIIRELFRFGLPTGVQGIAMNVAGVLLLRFIGSLGQSAQ